MCMMSTDWTCDEPRVISLVCHLFTCACLTPHVPLMLAVSDGKFYAPMALESNETVWDKRFRAVVCSDTGMHD